MSHKRHKKSEATKSTKEITIKNGEHELNAL